jgi:hypothetical protein
MKAYIFVSFLLMAFGFMSTLVRFGNGRYPRTDTTSEGEAATIMFVQLCFALWAFWLLIK